jgi:hypothetical protein
MQQLFWQDEEYFGSYGKLVSCTVWGFVQRILQSKTNIKPVYPTKRQYCIQTSVFIVLIVEIKRKKKKRDMSW